MSKIISKNWRSLLVIGLLLMTVPGLAFGQTLEKPVNETCGITTPLGCIEYGIALLSWAVSVIIVYIVQFLIGIATGFFNVMIGFNQSLFDLKKNLILAHGFEITLNLANLGFVLVIIIIAFATILRIERFAIKQTLWKLIVAALLVNFSLVLVAPIIDFNNILGLFFINQGAQGTQNFSNNIIAAFNPASLFAVKEVTTMSSIMKIVALGLTPMLVAIFGMIVVIVMFAAAALLLVRYVILTILLILVPIAWLMWVLPNLSHLASKWWDIFLKWNLFLPAMTFFIYLSLTAVDSVGASINDGVLNSGTADFINHPLLLIENALGAFIQILIFAGLMVGGLMAANSFGLHGAESILGVANKAKDWTIGAPGRKIVTRGAGLIATGGLGYFGRKFGAAMLTKTPLRYVPGAQRAGNILTAMGAPTIGKEVEEYQKANYANFGNDQLKGQLRTLPAGSVARSALLAEASKRGLVNKKNISDADLKVLAQAAITTNPDVPPETIPAIKEILNVNPLLAPELTNNRLTVEKAVTKMSAAEAVKIDKDAIKDKRIALSLSPSKIGTIIRSDNEELRQNLRETLESLATTEITNANNRIGEIMKKLNKAKQLGEKEKIKNLQGELQTLNQIQELRLASADESEKAAYEKLNTYNQIIGNIKNF